MSDFVVHSKFRDYQVAFIDNFTARLRGEIENNAFIIIDKNVFDLYRGRLDGFMTGDRYLVIEANEKNKTLDTCQDIIKTLVEKKVRRNQRLVAVGGGIIQDVTAFVASILYRGIEWVFFPTTLLAQADSCIGSKTSINLGDKKNLIGNFYPPSKIFIDTAFLDSLVVDDIKSGIGEMMHFYFYAGSPLLDKLVGNYEAVLGGRKLLREYIVGSLAIKKSVIEIDEFDKGERNKFNYGHTFGHALETVTDYAIRHGQAVTVGMDAANYVSLKIGMLPKAGFDGMHAKLAVNFPDYDFKNIDLGAYFSALSKDKKNIGNNLGCILSEGPGKLVHRQIPFDNTLARIIRAYFEDEL